MQGSYPHEWDEDFVTFSILKGLRDRFQSATVTGFPEALSTHWSAFKCRGPKETRYGDVAILVRATGRDQQTVTGVALLEAKKRDAVSSRFKGLRRDQLERIAAHAPHSMVLFYDYDKIPVHPVDAASAFGGWPPGLSPGAPAYFVTNAVAAPINVVTALVKDYGARDDSLYKRSVPFSHQLCFRYLRGFDLEMSEEAVLAARGYESRIGAHKYLLVVDVSSVEDREPPWEEDLLVNRDFWEPLDSWEPLD